MKKRFYVIDSQENTTSWNAKTEKGEDFGDRTAALRAAKKLAQSEPHKAFYVCETIDILVVETTPVKRIILDR